MNNLYWNDHLALLFNFDILIGVDLIYSPINARQLHIDIGREKTDIF